MLEGMRKRIILTPTQKRERHEAGGWATSTEDKSANRVRTPIAIAKPVLQQTPLHSFLIPQTIEDRRKAIAKKMLPSLGARKEDDSQKSSSFGSPKLRKREGRKIGAKKMVGTAPEEGKNKPRVKDIAHYFEGKAEPTNISHCSKASSNNNAVLEENALQCVPGGAVTAHMEEKQPFCGDFQAE